MNFFIKHKWGIYFTTIVVYVITIVFFTIVSYQEITTGGNPSMEALKTFLLGLSGAGVISTIFLSVLNSIEDRYLKIIENTFSLISQWDDSHLAAARKFTRKLKETKPKMSDEEFLSSIDRDEELKHSIVLVCNFFDQIRISHEMGRIDIKILNDSLGAVMEDYYHRMMPYVKKAGGSHLKDWNKIYSLSKIGGKE